MLLTMSIGMCLHMYIPSTMNNDLVVVHLSLVGFCHIHMYVLRFLLLNRYMLKFNSPINLHT